MFTKTDLCFIKEDDVHGYSTGISLSKAELRMRMSTSWVSAFLMENRVMVNRRRGHRLRNEVVSRCGWLGSIHQLFYQPDRNTAGCLLIPRVIYTYSQTHTHTPFFKPTKNRPESQRGAHKYTEQGFLTTILRCFLQCYAEISHYFTSLRLVNFYFLLCIILRHSKLPPKNCEPVCIHVGVSSDMRVRQQTSVSKFNRKNKY